MTVSEADLRQDFLSAGWLATGPGLRASRLEKDIFLISDYSLLFLGLVEPAFSRHSENENFC